jgi:glycosyltransferase involved in cell wall biosynthesis
MAQVSLIIPNFNNAKFLAECLDSALAQTRPFDEIIVVDDASTDESVQIIKRIMFEAKQVRLIALSERSGVSVARNRGIQAATSPFITTLDSDDFFWNERKNELEMGLIEADLPRSNVVAFSDVQCISVSGAPTCLVSDFRPVRQGALFDDMLRLRCFVPRDFTFAVSAYREAGGYDERFSLYEDWDLKLRLSRFCHFRFTGDAGVAYRSNPNGLSRAPLYRHFIAMYRVAMKNTDGLQQPRKVMVRLEALSGIARFLRGGIKPMIRGLLGI